MSLSGQPERTLDYLPNVSDIPTLRRLATLTGHAQESVQQLRKILQIGLTTRLDHCFMGQLNGVQALVQPSRAVDLIKEEDLIATRMAG